MRRFIYVSTFLITCCLQLAAQTTEQIVVKAGDDVVKGFSPSGFFRFFNYTDGTITLKNGSKSGGKFNYNVVLDQMHFISPNGDTMVADPTNIDIVVIGTTQFLYNKGYIEILSQNNIIYLGKKVSVKYQAESVGAYGMANQTASVDHYKQIFAGNSYTRLNINQNIVFTKRTTFWLIDKNKNVIPANRKNFLKLYPADQQAGIEEYIKKNDIDFDKEDELIQLVKQFPG